MAGICEIRGIVFVEVVQRENTALGKKKKPNTKPPQNLCHLHRCKQKVPNWRKFKMNHA